MATSTFQRANYTPRSHLALLYILWLSVKEVSKLPRCWSRTCIPPALLRRAGIVWDFLSVPVCLDNQASCTLQGEAKTAGLDEQQRPHHNRITGGTRMETWPPSNALIWLILDNPSGNDQATLSVPDGPRANERAVLLLGEQRCVSPAAGWGGHCQPATGSAWAWGSHAGAGGEGRGRVLR